MPSLPKQYNPAEHEEAIYASWERSGVFKSNPEALAAGKKPFVIMLPLPNITGNLHMGHALQHTIMDILIRYHRMLGDPTLWQPGTDHAGIATQNVVEKELRQEGSSRQDLGREEFLKRVWAWRDRYGNEIVRQMKRLGSSCDWDRLTFTMDPDYVAAVQHTFIEYYNKGYIYRGNRIVNWCPHCQSVISDLEVQHQDSTTKLTTLTYPLKDGSGDIKVATTRPETMLGDTAVAVNPNDKRYHKVVGQTVILPITSREVPIVADERVDQEFGTGAVKVTPAHDPLDAEIAETHQLPAINVVGEDGTMTEQAGDFAGLTVEQAREAVLQQLKAVVSEEDYRHSVATCTRCDTVIQPLISRQWFVDMQKLKTETIEVADNGLVELLPARWKQHFLDWMNNVHDWTISRQLWWGQRIPVWWKAGTRGTENEEGSFVVALEQPAGDYEQDPDVLDTWFSSALWPLVTLGWPKNTKDLETFYPTSVLITARDILYLWVARMMFSGLNLMQGADYGNRDQAQRIPFRQVFIHPTVLTKTGQRMSKSLGTGVDPLELIDEYGADATRFGLMYQMSYDNQAIKFDEQGIKSARNFANKIWNIARFLDAVPEQDNPSIADQWITERANQVTADVNRLLGEYKIGEAARTLYEFIWNDVADWYIEILKVGGSTTTARQVFSQTLRLLHPFMPHLTEVLWQSFGDGNLLIGSNWPTPKKTEAPEASQAMTALQDIVRTIRGARTLLEIPPGATIKIAVADPVLPEALAALAKAEIGQQSSDMLALPLSGGGSVSLASEHITPESLAHAREKLAKEIATLEQFIDKQKKTLHAMRAKAPADAIADKEAALKEAQTRLDELKRSQQLLAS